MISITKKRLFALCLFSALIFLSDQILAVDIPLVVNLTSQEIAFLAKNNQFTLCVDPAFMPYERINQQGRHEGLFADFLALIATKSSITFKLVPTEDYPQTRDYFRQGKCDVIAGDTEPTASVDYLATKPYFIAESAFAVRDDQPDYLDFAKIADKKIGFIEGADLSVVRKSYPGINLIGVDSDLTGIRKVATGELDSFISTMASIDYAITNYGITRVKLGGKIADEVNFSMLVNKQLPLLVSILNKGIDRITSQERHQIVQRWFHPIFDKQRKYEQLWILLYVSLAVLAYLFIRHFFQMRHNRVLRQDISDKDLRFRDLVENSHDWIWELDAQARYTYVSPRIKDFLGYEPAEFTGHTPFDFMPLDEKDGLSQSFKKIIKSRLSFDTVENVMLHRDGHKVVLESSGTPVFKDDGTFLGYRGSDRNITERKETERELERYRNHLEEMVSQRTAALELANEELKAFSYSVSHDLRSPLRVIDGFSQAVLEDYAEAVDDKGKDFLQRIRNGTHHMGDIIDAMLSLSRVSQVDLEPQYVDLSAMAEAIVKKYQDNEPGRAVEVEIMPEVHCLADKSLIRIVLDNLLGNAWKYTGKSTNARLEFGVRKKGGVPLYYVRDNGVGFDMKFAGKLFGAFQRLHKPEDYEGTGIGLVTVSRIVRRHGGEVWADAQPGRGAAFYFTLNTGKGVRSAVTVKEAAEV
jgi:PAS domain S-box-containing protein